MKKLPLYRELPQAVAGWEDPSMPTTGCQRCSRWRTAKSICIRPEGEPGGLLVISEYPGRDEDARGVPMVGQTGIYLRRLLKKLWHGPVAITNALGCYATGEVNEDDVAACRTYLAQTLHDTRPTRILLLGSVAGLGLLGRRFQPTSVRKGYGWWADDKRLPGKSAWVPAFMLMNPAAGLRNVLFQRAFEEDLKWALTCELPDPVHVGAYTLSIEDEADAQQAYNVLSECDLAVFDTETSGILHERGFRVETISFWPITAGKVSERGFTFDRHAIEQEHVAKWIRRILTDYDIAKGGVNTKYDVVACEADPMLNKDGPVNYWISDAQLKRKLVEADTDARLATMAELVGMGGHKEEAHTAIGSICADLGKLAEEPYRKPLKPTKKNPTGTRPPHVPANFHRASVPQWQLDAIYDGHEPIKFAYRYLDPDIRQRYNAADALSSALVELWADSRLDDELRPVWDDITSKMMYAIVRMEQNGVLVDDGALTLLEVTLDKEIAVKDAMLSPYFPEAKTQEDLSRALNSPPQIAAFLTKINMVPKRRTKSGAVSTDAQALEGLKDKHPAIKAILERRSLVKLQSNYGRGMRKHVRSDGRIHTSYLVSGTECMPAGELVLTNRGYLPVETVRVGDLVLTHEGRARPVVRTSVYDQTPIIVTKLENGLQLRTTANHQFLTTLGWVRADRLTSENHVLVHTSQERWSSVPSWEEYEVSTWGRVRNKATGRVLSAIQKGKWGHLKVTLKRNGARNRGPDFRDFSIHRLVMATFGQRGLGEIRHLNGFSWDNSVENLSWGTSKENKEDARRHGTMSHRGSHAQRKLDETVVEILRDIPRGRLSDKEAARLLNVSRELVRDVRTDKRWMPEAHIIGKKVAFSTSRVISTELTHEATVYGLTVRDDESHVTGGMVTHNTGRPSTTDPNMLNIPSPKRDKVLGTLCRNVFVAPPGYTLLEGDQSQIEIRIGADLCEDPKMIAAVLSGKDFHRETAKILNPVLWKVLEEALGDKERAIAKQTNFAVFYELPEKLGFLLSKRINVKESEGDKIADAMFGGFIKLRPWMQSRLEAAISSGHSRTVWKGKYARRRPLWSLGDYTAEMKTARENAMRSSWNSEVQGTAADKTNAALGPFARWLDVEKIPARIILTVYDSILVEVRDDFLPVVARKLRECMTANPSKHVPMVADLAAGKAWGSLKTYEP